MTAIPTTSVGRTGLQIPILGLGCAPISGLYSPVSEAQAVQTVHHALKRGINFFDTAPLYGAGLSEKRLGLALAGVARESYVISSKVGRLVMPDGQVVFDFSRDGVRRSLEASLERLKLDYVDILLIHDPDDHYQQALDEAYSVLAEWRSQGVIRAIGAGMNQWQMEADFARDGDLDCFLLAGRHTLLEQGALEFLSMCQSKGISVFLGGVFNSGILASGAQPGAKYNYADASPDILARAQQIQTICTRHAVPLPAAALQFAQAHPGVTALIVGMRSPKEIADNLQAWQSTIPPALWADLHAEGLLSEAALTTFG